MTDATEQGATQSAPSPERKGNGATPAWNGTLALRKKVVANGEEVNELKFREPTGGDIERVGNPVILSVFEAQPKPVYDTMIMTQMMAHLAAVPPSTIRSLDPRDWQNGALLLFSFFVPDRWT